MKKRIKDLPKYMRHDYLVERLSNAVAEKRGRGVISVVAIRKWLLEVGIDITSKIKHHRNEF